MRAQFSNEEVLATGVLLLKGVLAEVEDSQCVHGAQVVDEDLEVVACGKSYLIERNVEIVQHLLLRQHFGSHSVNQIIRKEQAL